MTLQFVKDGKSSGVVASQPMMVWIFDRAHQIFKPNLSVKLLMLKNFPMYFSHSFCIAFDALGQLQING